MADYLTSRMPAVGEVSRSAAQRMLFAYAGPLTDEQIEAVLRVAVCRGQLIAERGATTIRRSDRVRDAR